MREKRLKRSDFLYIDFERRCNKIKEYFADQDSDSLLVYELAFEYIHRDDETSILELNDSMESTYNYVVETKATGPLLADYDKDSLYQFEQYFKIEYPVLNVIQDIINQKNISQNISDKKMYALPPDSQIDLDDLYPICQPSKAYLSYPARDAIEIIYGEKSYLSDMFINMPLIVPKKKPDVWTNHFALVVDPTKPKEETIAYLSKLLEIYQSGSNPIKGLDAFLENEPMKNLKVCKSIKECDIYKYDDKKPLAGRFADVLYIYDCEKLGYQEVDVLKEINEYWYRVRGDVNWKKYANRYPEFNQEELEYSWNYEEPEEDKPQYYKNNMHHETYETFLKLGKRLIDDGEFMEFISGIKKV